MSGLEFIAAIVDALAWPVTTVVIAAIVKNAWADSYEDEQ